MMKEVTLIRQTKGLNAQIENSQVTLDEQGFTFLDIAVNVDITDGSKVVRRQGFTNTIHSVAAHSIYEYDGSSYCVIGTNLYLVTESLVTYGIRNNLSNQKIYYQGVGKRVYYSNGILNGYIEGRISYPWEPSSYVGPRASVHSSDVTAPPVGKHLALYNGRIYLSEGATLWYTPFLWYDGVDKENGFRQFNSVITMVLPLDNGIVVGTANEVIFLSGNSPNEFTEITLLSVPPVENTGIAQVGFMFGDKIIPGKTAVFTTTIGIYAVTGSGEVFDITGNRLLFPNAVSGNAYITDNFYTVLIDE